jgi:hypothetical protein
MKRVITITFLLFPLLLAAQRYGIEYENNFESLSPFQGMDTVKSNPTAIEVSSTVKYGNQSASFLVNSSDSLKSSVMRSQFILPSNNLINFTSWYGMSFYLDEYPTNEFDSYSTLMEFDKINTEHLPPLLINYQGQYNYMTAIVGSVQSNGQDLETHWNIGPVKLKSWNDLIMNIKWSNDSSGYIKIWINDTLRLFVNGPNNTTPNYLRVGVDKIDWRLNWQTDETGIPSRRLLIDEFRVGSDNSDYYSVKPGDVIVLSVGTVRELSAIKIGKRVQLTWAEDPMSTYNRFEISRSSDGLTFNTIGVMNMTTSGEFKYFDNSPLPINYYRIKKIDSRGIISYGKIVLVKFDATPARSISVYDMSGKLVSVISVTDLEQFKRNSHLAHGIYILIYDNGFTKKIII